MLDFAPTMTRTAKLLGRDVPIRFEFERDWRDDAEGAGWINGTVELDGRRFDVGGGWVHEDGRVERYDWRDCGEVSELAEALGAELPEDRWALVEAEGGHKMCAIIAATYPLYRDLRRALPRRRPEAGEDM